MSRVVFGAILGLSKIAKPVSVMLQSGLAKQLVEADILLFIEPERVFITRCSGLPVGYVCQFSVGIHIWLKKRVATRERPRPRRASTFVGQRYSSLLSGDGKNPRRRISDRSFQNFPKRLPWPGLPLCNITTVGRRKKARRTDWSGQWRTLERKRHERLYIAAGIKESVCEP